MQQEVQERMDLIRSAALVRSSRIIRPIWYEEFLDNPQRFYKTYYVPKTELKKQLASGMKLSYPKSKIPGEEMHKWRKICAPTDPLKEVQRNISFALYNRSPSPFDYCVRGRNRYLAMRPHIGKRIIIAMDIKNAFPSVTRQMVEETLEDEQFCPEDIEFISNIATLNGSLPQGSPSSPALLNLVRKILDYRLSGYIKSRYIDTDLTVYVDNYFISSNSSAMNKCIPALKQIAETERLRLNNRKIYIMRPGHQMGGLGLVINRSIGEDGCWDTVQPPRHKRNRIRAMLHQAKVRLESGQSVQSGFNILKANGLVETCKGSIYYDRFKGQLKDIKEMISRRS